MHGDWKPHPTTPGIKINLRKIDFPLHTKNYMSCAGIQIVWGPDWPIPGSVRNRRKPK